MNKFIFLLLFISTDVIGQQAAAPVAITANSFFEDTKITALARSAIVKDNIVAGLVDDETGEQVSFAKTALYEDGSAMNADKVDGVIYRKKGNVYYKRVYQGAVNVKWFGAKGDGRNDDTKAIQKAIDLYNNVYLPKGQYQVSGIMISKNRVTLYGEGNDKSKLYAIGNQEYVLAVKYPKSVSAVLENVHIYDLMLDGAYKSKYGLFADIIASLIERINISSCLEYGILHHHGYTSTYRDCYVTNCAVAGLNVYQEGNLLLFESCLFSNNKGSGVLFYSGNTSIFLKCSIENNGGYGILLTYQQDPAMAKAPFVQTATAMITFLSCFFEGNCKANPKLYANITMIGQPDPNYLKVRNIVVKNCHFGLGPFERAVDIRSDIQYVTIEDNFFAYMADNAVTPILIGSYFIDDQKRVASGLQFRNNFYHKNDIEISNATPMFSKNATADLLGSAQKAVVNVKGISFTVYKSGKTASVYINGTSTGNIEQNLNLSPTGILVATGEKLTLSNKEQNGFLFETSMLKDGNIIHFACAAGKTFNNTMVMIPCQY